MIQAKKYKQEYGRDLIFCEAYGDIDLLYQCEGYFPTWVNHRSTAVCKYEKNDRCTNPDIIGRYAQ